MGTFKVFDDLTGRRFARIFVLSLTDPLIKKTGKKETRWLCECECGNITKVLAYNLKNGTTKSCGCLLKEARKKNNRTHGFSKHPIYSVLNGLTTPHG